MTQRINSSAVDATVNVKLTGDTVQVVNSQVTALATGTTIIPRDDTIPQITEGDQYLSLAITPTSASNTLIIDVVIALSNSANTEIIAALFQDSTANALKAACSYNGALDATRTISFRHIMTAGTTSATTFRVRAGGANAGTTTLNGIAGARLFGGVAASSITITEIRS